MTRRSQDWKIWPGANGRSSAAIGSRTSPRPAVVHIHEETPAQIKRRHMREALALKQIFPDSHVTLPAVSWRSCCRMSAETCSRQFAQGKWSGEFFEILMFRAMQYWGTYRGMNYRSPLTHELITKFYYPRVHSLRQPPTAEPHRSAKAITMPRGAERAVALLPIKGHSERIAGKNFRDFCGKPLFAWILDTLLSMPEIELVVINTDAEPSSESLAIHRLPRVQLRERKPELCGDLVSMNLVLEDDICGGAR